MTVSLWQDMAIWRPDEALRREECDVCVVGAGVVGAYLWGLDQVLQPFVREVLLGG